MKKSIDSGKIVFTFEDGIAPIVFDPAATHVAVQARAQLHGFMARLGDAAAIPRTLPNGGVITVTEAMRAEAVQALVDHYAGGSAEWCLGGGRTAKAPAQNATIAAIAAKRGITYAEAEAAIANAMLAEM